MTRLALLQWMHQHDGIAHSQTLRAAGYSDHDIRSAVGHGDLQRVRRSWLAVRACDPRRLAAAAIGGRPTCASAAALAGLWNVGADTVHVAVARTASRLDRKGVTIHTAVGPVPVSRYETSEPILNVLFHVARCLPRGDALAIWESAVRRNKVDVDVLERVRWRSAAASDLAAVVGSRSDSGPETAFVALMRDVGVTVKQQAWVDGHPLDGLIGDRLGIQIDGFAHHSSPKDRRRDIRADARLALRGFTLLRFDVFQVTQRGFEVQQVVLQAIAQGLHLKRR